MDWLNWVLMWHPQKQVGVKQWYNPVRQTVRVSWRKDAVVRTSSQRWLDPQDSRLNSPAERERSAAKDRWTWGQYAAVCRVSNSPLTHNSCATLSNKMRGIFFSKEVCSFVINVDFASACICVSLYMYYGYATVIPIVVDALGTVTKGLEKRLDELDITEGIETIQTTAVLKSAWILRRVLEIWRNFQLPKLKWKTIRESWC